jgi:hypothetical protein
MARQGRLIIITGLTRNFSLAGIHTDFNRYLKRLFDFVKKLNIGSDLTFCLLLSDKVVCSRFVVRVINCVSYGRHN